MNTIPISHLPPLSTDNKKRALLVDETISVALVVIFYDKETFPRCCNDSLVISNEN